MAFDKTGTLTAGTPHVTAVVPLNGRNVEDVRRLAAALETRSQHPLVRAIVADAAVSGLGLPEVTDFRSLTGRGVSGTVEGTEYRVGVRALFPTGLSPAIEAQMQTLEETGATVVIVGKDAEPIGLIGLKDVPKPEAAAMIAALQGEGIRTVMVTGDNEGVAAVIGLVTLWEAVGFGDMELSLLVILNALRLVAR